MSSRILRRLQGKDNFFEQIDDDTNDSFENDIARGGGGGGARRKTLRINPFDVLDQSQSQAQSESDTKDDVDKVEIVENIERSDSHCKKKKKKKKKVKSAYSHHKQENDLELDDAIFNASQYGDNKNNSALSSSSNVSNKYEKYEEQYSSIIHIKVKNLNADNELKRIFGTRIVENDNGRRRNRGRTSIKTFWLVNPKETWPSLSRTGISMRVEKVDGNNSFTYTHSPDYQTIQKRFLYAVDSLNPDNIAAIINAYPYHVDALIQLSDLYKLNDDLQVAAELNERALYCLEAAFHPLFNIARGNCILDYRRQENRAFFICLFKHLIFVGQRACYQTALELCKFLLSLDFDADPLATVLCIDFYSLRSRNYTWLIEAAEEWEPMKNLSQLPNFAYSTALAHFYIADNNNPLGDYSVADRLLQDALMLFPRVLLQLIEKCSIQCDPIVSKHPYFTSEAEFGQSKSLTRLILLYVNRTYHEWKNPKILPWLERNVHEVLERVDSDDYHIKECAEKRSKRYPSTPRNVLRHIILSDMKEVTSTIASDITSPILSFDPLPPVDSLDLYSRQERELQFEHSPTLSLFFRSLLPNFHMNTQQGNRVFMDQAPLGEAAGMQVAEGEGPAAIGDTLRYSVTVLMDAIGLVLANMPMRGDGSDNVLRNAHNLRREAHERNQFEHENNFHVDQHEHHLSEHTHNVDGTEADDDQE